MIEVSEWEHGRAATYRQDDLQFGNKIFARLIETRTPHRGVECSLHTYDLSFRMKESLPMSSFEDGLRVIALAAESGKYVGR